MASASGSNPIAAAATTSIKYFHVFLSHRGTDLEVTKNLATLLYERLEGLEGLKVFLDKKELQVGDDIPSHLKTAILCASVNVVIFSVNYATSSWCLNELQLMVESKKSTILPIFYGVKPAELRWTFSEDGVYAKSFRDLETKKTIDPESRNEIPRYSDDTIRKWREALSAVADIMGLEYKEEACKSDDGQRKFVDDIVKLVLEKRPKTALSVAKYPTGLEDKVRDFERSCVLMPQQSGKAKVVGIVGLGGVGKTTLAKEYFNRERSKYHRSCFLFDIKEASRSLDALLSTLGKELTGSQMSINSTHDGIEELRRRVSSCHSEALIVLDDVDNIEQLNVLLFPVENALSSSSLILVTSRNKDVLTNFGIVGTSIYKLEGLNPEHSRELFCMHAKPKPDEQFQPLVEGFLDACQGLPLSLVVIGASLCGSGQDDLRYWEAQLRKVSKTPPKDIQSKLKISFDGLDREEKKIFLDIACFFTGQRDHLGTSIPDMDTAIRVWDGSGWQGWLGLQKLQNRCLVDVVEGPSAEYHSFVKKQYLIMHDNVRDLGRCLAEEEPDLGGHRLWRPTENLLHNLADQSAVRGLLCYPRLDLISDNNRKQRSISWSRLELLMTRGYYWENMSYYLENTMTRGYYWENMTRGYYLENILRSVQSPEHLIWLHCDDFPFPDLPRWIPMDRLRVLNVQGGTLRGLWGDQAPLQLRQLDIAAPLLEFPRSMRRLEYLEKIVLRPPGYSETFHGHFYSLGMIPQEASRFACYSGVVPLKTLPHDFCYLRRLQHLELYFCLEMESLPESFGNLENLEHLQLAICSNLRELPNSFGKLIKLKRLCLRECNSLTMSSETLGNITTLEFLDMTFCKKIEVLPRQVAHQPFLSQLLISGTSIRELPSAAVEDLTALEILEIGDDSLERLPDRFGCLKNLKELRIWGTDKIKCLPDSIGELTQLEKLTLFTGVECLPPWIMELNKLVELQVISDLLRELPFNRASTDCLLGLTDLYLGSTKISEVIFGKGVCPILQRLHISGCELLVEVGPFPDSLKELDLSYCPRLKRIEGLCDLAKLKSLIIRDCPKVEQPSGLGALESLERLELIECRRVRNIPGLQGLTKLRQLRVSGCDALKELAGIEHALVWLSELWISDCPTLTWRDEVRNLLHKREREGLRYTTIGGISSEELSEEEYSSSD